MKLARQDLEHADPLVRRAAIAGIRRLLPAAQRSLVLGPLLDDDEQSVRFAAVDALLGLDPDAIGLYFGPLQAALEQYQQALEQQPEDADAKCTWHVFICMKTTTPRPPQPCNERWRSPWQP